MNRSTYIAMILVCIGVLLAGGRAGAKIGNLLNTKHNLSVSGPGNIKALTETRVCVFCHTPHNAAPLTPLWNKQLEPVNYDVYASTSLHVTPAQPVGPSRLCLSCHDGTVALGAVLRPAEGITVAGAITPDSPSFIGTSLKGHHPIVFSYFAAASVNHEISPAPPAGLHFTGIDAVVHCTTCHEPHDDTYGKFLIMDNKYSALCMQCHVKNGWVGSAHQTSTAVVTGILPVPPRTLPATWLTTWTTVNVWGCEGCHAPHSAGGQQRLLYFGYEENTCYPCHNGNVALKNIYAEFQKLSKHALPSVAGTAGLHSPVESPARITNHVECADCHDPHAVNGTPAAAPFVSGKLVNVTGVDINGNALLSSNPYAAYEYQICFKCHADSTPDQPFSPGFPIKRVVNTTNMRYKFDPVNPSYHPVEAIGKNTANVPSIPSQYVTNTMTSSSIIYCMDCHESDDSSGIPGANYSGPRGPHGSLYAPLLRELYVTADNTPESYSNYALCYRCHNRDVVLNLNNQNQSFSRHYSHVVTDKAPCSACHDPHGVKTGITSGDNGDHTRLINFDATIVTAAPGNLYPNFTAASMSCTLVCHGVTHPVTSPGSLRMRRKVMR